MRYAVILYLLLCCATASAQQSLISGKLTDKDSGLPITAASINIKTAENKILAFKTTDARGEFRITLSRDLQGCFVEINHLGYKKYRAPLDGPSTALHIALEQQSVLLDDVEVKSKPMIRRMGDTLAYRVDAFAKEEDRSIGDVLKRMPGMEVSESGRIKYQGKEISNFYIDGDDLLDDRYALGTRTIPHKMVQDIQVLNNHEHLKVLKNKRFTDQVAINLVIKDDAQLKMTAEAKLGAGLPQQYDSELNSILFNKKYKMLNVLNGNNTGKDLSPELIGFNRESTLLRLGSMPINNLLSLGTVGDPPIAKLHYFMNNSAALNTNNLFNVGHNWQIKSNIQGLINRSHQNFAGSTDYLVEGDVISFAESQYSTVSEQLAAIRLSANKNVDNRFINNALSVEYEKEDARADIRSNGQDITADRLHRIRGISNRLEYVPALKNGKIVQFNWFFNYGTKPQELRLSPGIFPQLLHAGAAYDETTQRLNVPNLFTQLSAGYRLSAGKISQYYHGTVQLEDQRLSSSIDLSADGQLLAPQLDSAANGMHWQRWQYTAAADYGWKKKRFEALLSLPVSFQTTAIQDPAYALNEQQQRWLLLPSLRLKYRAWKEDDVDLNYNFANNFGNIQDVYRGLIIRNYRSISQNTAEINESATHTLAANYRLNRTLQLLYANLGISYNKTFRKAMLAQQISNSISQTVLLPFANEMNTLTLQAGIDKYIFPLAGTVKLRASWSHSQFEQLFNSELLPFQNNSYTLQPEFEIKLWRQVNLSYQGSVQWSSSTQAANENLNNEVFSVSQNVGLPFNLFKGMHLRLSGRHLYTRQPLMNDFNYVFADAFLRYRVAKWKTDVELQLSNLANIKTFQTYAISANQRAQNDYELRGRMAVLKVVFAL